MEEETSSLADDLFRNVPLVNHAETQATEPIQIPEIQPQIKEEVAEPPTTPIEPEITTPVPVVDQEAETDAEEISRPHPFLIWNNLRQARCRVLPKGPAF